ncbi:HAD family hydrolase [Streptomyces oceani]|uniref:HAD family hydrolase n=1 Tax=Streptomyces oceani TaxID=1075402 RepID=UPI000872EADE|nr:HAD family hydrolase [Streptomyces oceani]
MLPVHGPEGPIRTVVGTERTPAPVRAALFDFSGTLFQIGTYAERIRSALARPVDEATMDALLGGLETGLSDHRVVAAQQGRDVSAEAHRHAFTTWYASVPELAPVADVLYEQLRTPEHWVPYADSESVLRQLTQAGVALGLVSDVGRASRPKSDKAEEGGSREALSTDDNAAGRRASAADAAHLPPDALRTVARYTPGYGRICSRPAPLPVRRGDLTRCSGSPAWCQEHRDARGCQYGHASGPAPVEGPGPRRWCRARYLPTAFRSASTRSVRSQVKSGSSRPK